tara:strand:+ start:545 stop:802 length:258 start_codon:yes stop_codon:yes gene_type:complete
MNQLINEHEPDAFLKILLKIVSIPILWGSIQLIFTVFGDIDTYIPESLLLYSALGFILLGIVLRFVVKYLFNKRYPIRKEIDKFE